jgi:hypothetical protein
LFDYIPPLSSLIALLCSLLSFFLLISFLFLFSRKIKKNEGEQRAKLPYRQMDDERFIVGKVVAGAGRKEDSQQTGQAGPPPLPNNKNPTEEIRKTTKKVTRKQHKSHTAPNTTITVFFDKSAIKKTPARNMKLTGPFF